MADIAVDLQTVQGAPRGTTVTEVTMSGPGDTYVIPNADGKTLVRFLKKSAGDATVTIETPRTVGGVPVEDKEYTAKSSILAPTGNYCASFKSKTYGTSLRCTASLSGVDLVALRIR